MSPIVLVIVMLLISGLAASLLKLRAEKSDQKPANMEKDKKAEEKYAAACEAGEKLLAVSRGFREEYYAVTDKRLIIDNKKGFQSIPFESIRGVVCKKADGDDAKSPSDTQVVTVFADKKYAMARYSGKFDQIVEAIWEL